MPVVAKLPDGYQARVHPTASICHRSWCPCRERKSVYFGNKKHGGEWFARQLAQQQVNEWRKQLRKGPGKPWLADYDGRERRLCERRLAETKS